MPGKTAQQRVLATIVFTDVVGYSARVQAAERHTLSLVRRDLAIISAECERCGGTVVKNTGDGLLMHFSTAGRAVECALRVQAAFARAAKGLAADDVLLHRIGIHLGDVFLGEGDAVGDGVNIAARLLDQAEPGGICLSQTVYDVVKNRLAVKATYLGPRELKNIAEAVPVYQIVLSAAAKMAGQKPAPAMAPVTAAKVPHPWLAAAAAALGLAALGIVALLMWRHPAGRSASASSTTPVRVAATRPADAPALAAASMPAATKPFLAPERLVLPYHRVINVLQFIDTDRDSVSGNWRRVQVWLTGTSSPFARIRIPFEPPEEYDLSAEFFQNRPGAVLLILTHRGRSFAWHMGDAQNTAAGFELVAGGKGVLNKTTVRADPFLKPGIWHRAFVEVRKNYIAAYLDDLLQATYPTDYSDLDLPPNWLLGEPSLGLGCTAATRFRQIQVYEVTGNGKLLHREKPATRPTQ